MTAMAALARRSHRFLSMRKAPHMGPSASTSDRTVIMIARNAFADKSVAR
jgi:hypothetical protein